MHHYFLAYYRKNKMNNIEKRGRPKKLEEDKAKPNDKVKCDICGKVFSRSIRSVHNKSQVHQAHLKANDVIKLKVNEGETYNFEDQCARQYFDRAHSILWLSKKQAEFSNSIAKAKGEELMYTLVNNSKKNKIILVGEDEIVEL
jgi:hypothetical protein